MQPSFEARITTMMKALSQTVRPALDEADMAAAEQLGIVIASLAILKDQVDYGDWFEVSETRSLAALIGTLAGLGTFPSADEALAAASDAAALAERHDRRLSTLRAANVGLRSTIHQLMEEAFATGDEGIRAQVRKHVLAHSAPQISRERAFVAGANFDVFAHSLKTIEQCLTDDGITAAGEG